MTRLNSRNRAAFNSLLDASAFNSAQPDKAAIIYMATDADPIIITNAELRTRSAQYGTALHERGITAGDLLIIAHTDALESIAAFWGALHIGAIPSMFPTLTEKLDRDIYMRDMAQLVRLSAVKAAFTGDDFAPILAQVVDCPVFSSSQMRAGHPLPQHTPEADTIAFLQHSSGTTGLQKGVALTHQATLNQLAAYSDALHLREDDVVVSWLPLYHDMGLIAGFLLPLMQGIPLVLMSPFDWVRNPALLLQAIDAHCGTLCWLPNFAYNHMARRIRKRDSEGLSLASMRAFINCSEPVRADSHALFLERFAANGLTPQMLAVSYAMAENTFAVTQSPIASQPKHDHVDPATLQAARIAQPTDAQNAQVVVSCGAPITNTEVRVLDESGAQLPERHIGEITIKSDCMLREYYRRDDLQPFTAEGWYRTGDMGYIAAGEVYIIGRAKDLIINAGKNVYPQDIEAIVNTIEGVHPGRAVAFGVADEREGTELIAVVAEVTGDDHKAINKAIRQRVAQQTTVTVNIVHLVESGWLIKTSSGKIARAANREKWLSQTKRS